MEAQVDLGPGVRRSGPWPELAPEGITTRARQGHIALLAIPLYPPGADPSLSLCDQTALL